ncbi:MAG: hypothetical protein ACRC6V_12210 [Bacteroidales bacterium]
MTEQRKITYENQYYAVVPNVSMDGYIILNKMTGVKEGGSEKLPSAVSQADVACQLLLEIIHKDRVENESPS